MRSEEKGKENNEAKTSKAGSPLGAGELGKLDQTKSVLETPEEELEIAFEEEEKSSFKGADIKRVKEKLKKCQKERQEYLDGWQRAKADFINARKADDKVRERQVRFAAEGVLVDLLPVADSFELAFSNKKAWESVDSNWRTGVEYIYSGMQKVFSDNGLSQTNPIGKKFDPTLHESVETIEVEEDKDGVIVEVAQKGYELNGKSLRPARVKVGVYKKEDK